MAAPTASAPPLAPPEPGTVRLAFSPAQTAFWRATERYIDLEGAVRAGKTTPAIARVIDYCLRFPGMAWLVARWTQDATDMQLKPRFRELCPVDVLGPWNTQEQYYDILTGTPVHSRVYIRGLKSSEDKARYSKFAGLTLAGIYVDQPEEIPHDFFLALQARLSQPGFPQQLLLTPNPPGEDHWLASVFPTDNSKLGVGYRYIRTSVYDNRAALGEAYIAALEEAYPAGTALRRRFVDGVRGLGVVGTPVYKDYFRRQLHEVDDLLPNMDLPVAEAWDFGHSHPCVLWGQFLPWGALHLVGGVMGEGMFIEDFAPAALAIRQQWFGQLVRIVSTGDPAGDTHNSQGTNRSAADVLRQLGVDLDTIPGANAPDRRNTAIQAAAGYMRRLAATGPAFRASSRFLVIGPKYQRVTPVLIDALEAGYVWDERSIASSASPSTRRPKKDGYYDHVMNCLEYLVLRFGPPLDVKPKKPVPLENEIFVPVDQRGQGWMI